MNIAKTVVSLSLTATLFFILGCAPKESAEEICPICLGAGVVEAVDENGVAYTEPCECVNGTVETETSVEGFEMLSGEEFDLTQYKGSVVVVDVWATWCPPCKKEIPHLIEINNEYKDKDVVMIGISMDDNAMSVIPKFAEKEGMNYINFDGKSGDLEKEYNSPYLPTKYFYDKDGNEVHSQFGMMSKEDITGEIDKLL